jgi:hypothetical protein
MPELVWDDQGPAGDHEASPAGERLGELLVRRGLISGEQLAHALGRQQAMGMRLGTLLVMSGWITEDALTAAVAEQAGIPVLDLSEITPDHDAVRALPERDARALLAVPVAFTADGAVVAAVTDPAPRVRHRLEQATGTAVRMHAAGPSLVRRLIDEAHGRLGPEPPGDSPDG